MLWHEWQWGRRVELTLNYDVPIDMVQVPGGYVDLHTYGYLPV